MACKVAPGASQIHTPRGYTELPQVAPFVVAHGGEHLQFDDERAASSSALRTKRSTRH